MFLDYLREKENELKEVLYVKKKALAEVSRNIKENRMFSDMLEQSKATPFTEFTPQIITATDKKKQEDLSLEESALLKKQEALEVEISSIEAELQQVSMAITDIKKAFAASRKNLKDEREYIVSKIKSIMEINLSDPMRGNLELKELLKTLSDKPLP